MEHFLEIVGVLWVVGAVVVWAFMNGAGEDDV